MSKLSPSAEEGVLHVVVESPAGSNATIKWDPHLETFVLVRPLPIGMSYPHDWGFIPGTHAADGDPLEALVLREGTTFPGLLLQVRPIAVLRLEQNRKGSKSRERNDRVIAVLQSAPRSHLQGPDDLPVRLRAELQQFFLNVAFFEAKDPVVLGWGGPDDAWRLVRALAQQTLSR